MQVDQQRKQFIQRITILSVVLVLLLLGLGISKIVSNSNFRVTGTNPKLSAVSTESPYIQVKFNQPVEASSVKLDDPDNAIDTVKVTGNTVTLNLQFNLTKDKEYRLALLSVRSSENEEVTNYDLTFKAKYIPYDKLPKDQQQASISRQSDKPYTVDFINYQNFETLMDDYGMTADQLLTLKRWLFDYSNSIKKEYRQMTLNTDSIVFAPYNPDEADVIKADFVVVLGGIQHPTHIEYDPLYNAVRVIIKDQTGKQLFDSGSLGD